MIRKLIILGALCIAFGAYAQDTIKITPSDSLRIIVEKLQNRIEQLELKELRREALSVQEKKEKKKFTEKARSLQILNPELSITGDFYAGYLLDAPHFSSEQRSGLGMRVMGIHWQSALDPFSMMKVAVEFTEEGVELAEAYAIWNGILPGVGIRLGLQRQEFGAINRWHEHALDQFDFPLVLEQVFGEEGLTDLSATLDLNLPVVISPLTQNLIVSFMNGTNENLFTSETFHFPALTGRLKNFFHLSQSTYLDLGFSGLWGKNQFDGYVNGVRQKFPAAYTYVLGSDLSLVWEPSAKSLYRNVVLKAEIMHVKKEDPTAGDISLTGGYAYLQAKLNRRLETGFRVDYTQPFEINNTDIRYLQYVPYLTWWQSEYVRIRLQLNIPQKDLKSESPVFLLQLTWAAGPHKHEKY